MSDPTIQAVSGQSECPECYEMNELKEVMQHEIVSCSGCQASLEVAQINPIVLVVAPEEAEDWGE